MQQQHQQLAGRNAQPLAEASIRILTEMLHGQVGKLVLNTIDFAALLGKSEHALRLAESRHRARHGRDLLPQPLLKNVSGRIWSIEQVARWMVQGGASAASEEALAPHIESPRRPGRPRKSTSANLAA